MGLSALRPHFLELSWLLSECCPSQQLCVLLSQKPLGQAICASQGGGFWAARSGAVSAAPSRHPMGVPAWKLIAQGTHSPRDVAAQPGWRVPLFTGKQVERKGCRAWLCQLLTGHALPGRGMHAHPQLVWSMCQGQETWLMCSSHHTF